MTAARLIKNARDAAQLDQRALAHSAKSSQSQLSLIETSKQEPSFETVVKLLRAAGRQVIAIDTLRADAATISSEIRVALAEDKNERALRLFIQLSDNLCAEHGAQRFALTISRPPSTGSKRWDSAIAALAAHWLTQESLPIPMWASSKDRFLDRAWVFANSQFRPSPESVPQEFSKRGVLLDADTLASV